MRCTGAHELHLGCRQGFANCQVPSTHTPIPKLPCPPRPPAPTCEDGQPAHGGEGVVAGRVQDVQLVHVTADVVNLPVEVLDGGCVLVLEAAIEEAGDNGALAHPRGAQHHHAVRVLGRHTECTVPAGQGLHHGSGLQQREGVECQEAGGLALQPVLEAVASPVSLLLGSVIAQLIIHLQCERPGFDSWVGKILWRREKLPTPIFWPGELHGLYNPWGCKESDTTARLSLTFLSVQWESWTEVSLRAVEFCLNTPLLFLSPFIYLPIFTHSLTPGSFTPCLFPDGTVGAGLLDLPLTHYSSGERSLTSLGIAFLIYKVDLIHRAVVKGSAHGKVSKMLTLFSAWTICPLQFWLPGSL